MNNISFEKAGKMDANIHSASTIAVTSLLRQLAAKAMGMTGADIERVVREARLKARREKRIITYNDLELGIRNHRPVQSPEKLWRSAIHEAGHAIVHYLLAIGPIEGVTIDSLDGAYGALRLSSERGDTKDWVFDVLTMLMAGRAAEMSALGEVSAAGAGTAHDSDLARATDIALSFERTSGLGEDLPLLYREVREASFLLDRDRALAKRIHDHLEQAQERASLLIVEHSVAFDELALALLDAQALGGDEVKLLLDNATKSHTAQEDVQEHGRNEADNDKMI